MTDGDPTPPEDPGPPIPAPSPRQEVVRPEAEDSLDIRASIEAAEVAAEEIRRDAEERAAAHLQAAHEQADRLTAERVHSIASVTDELIGQAATIRAHSDELANALKRATETLTRAVSTPAVAPPAPSPTAISATGVHEGPALGTGSVDPDGPEFRARQLAAAGASRRTIAIVLRREFNVEPMPILERAGIGIPPR